jgi:hypothetical protein
MGHHFEKVKSAEVMSTRRRQWHHVALLGSPSRVFSTAHNMLQSSNLNDRALCPVVVMLLEIQRLRDV